VRRVPLLLVLLVLLGGLTGCATNPATGKLQLALVSESQEIAMGRQYAPQIESAMGATNYPELNAYVESIAMPMALASERPNLPWQFRVIDDPAVNAFAVPGGFVYVTRGILAHMGSEAQLASVLGHEIGHVTARHSVNQMSKQQLAQVGLVAGAVLLGESGEQLMPLASAGLGLLFLKYGRDHERQSDDLGLRYMSDAGYAPGEMVAMCRTLGRSSQAAGAGQVPEWLATHPSPENREARMRAAIEASGAQGGATAVGRAEFLRRLEGLTYGPDPRAGFFAGDRFHHPELRFRLDFPSGWQTANQPQAVMALSAERDAMLQLTLAGEGGLEELAEEFFAQEGLTASEVSSVRRHGLAGVTGGFTANTEQGELEGRALFALHGERVYRLLGYAPKQAFADRRSAIEASLESFAPETDRRVLGVEPWSLQIVTPPKALSIEEFARRYPGPVSAEDLARINELDPGERYRAGVPVKRVRGASLPGAD